MNNYNDLEDRIAQLEQEAGQYIGGLISSVRGRASLDLVSFGKSSSSKLKESVDDFFDLCENPRRYIIGGMGLGGAKKPRKILMTDEDLGIDRGEEEAEKIEE
jgi:hypothetical protein